jgi:tRNA nucleotidyltransferase/poly(A) polymerase
MFDTSFSFIKKIKINLFPFYKNKEIQFVFKKFQEGFPAETIVARFVGGCFRKYLLNEEVDDIDIATVLSSKEIKEKFQNTKFKVVDTGLTHGTVTLVSERLKLEVTTLRKDVRTDGRHAEVEYINNWQLDSERRDFTINAIYLDIKGNIFDPQAGTIDLKNNNVKFIGDPQKRIEEDYLRIIRFIRFKIMYNSTIEPTTNNAIKLNINGIKNISKERVLVELYKILDLKNFMKLNKTTDLKEIFNLIFPEFENLKRLDKLKKICNYLQVNRNLLLATLLIDDKNSHEYFGHKYNISNNIKEELNFFARKLKIIEENKDFFNKDLEKNIYLYDKKYLINLNILNFVINAKVKLDDFLIIFKKILKSKTHKFTIDGKYLMKNGMQQGALMGKVLKKIEEEWIGNDFKITKDKIQVIIKSHSN